MRDRLVRQLREQGKACGGLGSPMYAELLYRAADDAARGGVVARVLAGYENAPGSSALPLRLAGAVHRLVLEGAVPELAAHYPSVDGTADPLTAWPAFERVLAEHHDTIRALLHTPPQTNEVGRAAALLGGLLHVAATSPAPVRLLELGASAGLNLRADHYRYELGRGRAAGPRESPVTLRGPWRAGGAWPRLDAPLLIVERTGCDPAPIDASTPAGRLRLASYVWPDQVERLARLRGACEVAARVPATVVRGGGAEFFAGLRPRPDVTTVIWHSVVWQYIDREEREIIRRQVEWAGAAATAEARVAHLWYEPLRRTTTGEWYFALGLRQWPDGTQRLLGEGQGHGPPLTWY